MAAGKTHKRALAVGGKRAEIPDAKGALIKDAVNKEGPKVWDDREHRFDGKTALPKKPPFSGKADHDDYCHYAQKLLAARRIFGRLVNAVMAKFDEHVAVHCNQR